LIIHKTCEVYSLWFFEELRELIGISRGVHLDLSNGVSTTVCGVFLIPRFLFVIKEIHLIDVLGLKIFSPCLLIDVSL
jgi:hypothetical protein